MAILSHCFARTAAILKPVSRIRRFKFGPLNQPNKQINDCHITQMIRQEFRNYDVWLFATLATRRRRQRRWWIISKNFDQNF